MVNNRPRLEQTLRESGQNVTGPRLAVFDYLSGRGPVSIYSVVTDCMTSVDRASIYRTLSLYRQLGIINDLMVAGQKVIELSEEFSGHHHHLSCTLCGKSVDITDPAIERRLENVALAQGFLATAHQIEVRGLCSNCQ